MKKQLLVEGNDDLHVVKALCQRLTIPHNFDVIDCKGIENILEQIPLLIKDSSIDTIGIMIDADTNLQARYDSVKNKLSGFDFPKKLPENGLIIDNGEQKIGVWIMPDNNTNGMLEDFISFLVPENDKLMPIAIETLQDIEKQDLDKYKPHQSKAKIHTWLAWQEEPGKPLGQSITNKALSTDNETCRKFADWLKNLFE
jgi:hypothetical protein